MNFFTEDVDSYMDFFVHIHGNQLDFPIVLMIPIVALISVLLWGIWGRHKKDKILKSYREKKYKFAKKKDFLKEWSV